MINLAHRLTQHKRLALRVHPNFCFAKTSFMLGTLDNSSEMETHNKLLKNGYDFSKYKETDGWKRKYWKKVKK